MNEKLKASVLQYFDRLREYGLHGCLWTTAAKSNS